MHALPRSCALRPDSCADMKQTRTEIAERNREDYATIDNAVVLSSVFEDASCTSSPLVVPAGWRLADWDADVAFVSHKNLRRRPLETHK